MRECRGCTTCTCKKESLVPDDHHHLHAKLERRGMPRHVVDCSQSEGPIRTEYCTTHRGRTAVTCVLSRTRILNLADLLVPLRKGLFCREACPL